MESRKVVVMLGRNRDSRCREWPCGHSGGRGGVGQIEKVALKYIYHHV